MYNDGMSTSNSASSMTSSLPFDTISFTENIKDDCFRDLGISSGNGSRMTNSNSTQPVAIPNDWNNDKYLQIPTSTTLRPSVSTSHVSRCTCQSHRPSIVKLSYQNANVSYSTNSLAHGNQQHCNNRKLIASPKIYSNKMPSVGPNGRILVKGATFGERVAVSFDDELSCGSMECRQNRSCDWSTSQGNLLEYKPQHVTPANNQIAQVSSDILKVQGFTSQYRKLLSKGHRRESSPGGSLQDQSNNGSQEDNRRNGEVQFECAGSVDQESQKNGGQGSSAIVRKIKRRKSGYGISITSDSTAKMRCRQRKVLFEKRNTNCDMSLTLAILGLIFVVIDSELTALNYVGRDSVVSLGLRMACVLSTLLLDLSLINYHALEVKIALLDSGADDWRVALTTERVIKLCVELFVCSICPLPVNLTIFWPYINPIDRNVTMVEIPVTILMSIPCFLRAYLLCRFMVLHSKQFQDAATRSIAALNRISMDFRFVIKTMMANHPLRVLIIFTCSFWIILAWCFTQCERHTTNKNINEYHYINSLWFIIVTFMSIGYGDITPSTLMGKVLAIFSGIVGAGVSSALISVISRKLELSRAEKHVNNFMADSKLTNERKNAAASVLQQTWFIHKYQRHAHKGEDLKLRQHQRKFLQSINEFRRVKWELRKLSDRGNSLLDVGKLHNEMHETLWEMHKTQDQFITQISLLTQKITDLQNVILKQNNIPKIAENLEEQDGSNQNLIVPVGVVHGFTSGLNNNDFCSHTNNQQATASTSPGTFSTRSESQPKSITDSLLQHSARFKTSLPSTPRDHRATIVLEIEQHCTASTPLISRD